MSDAEWAEPARGHAKRSLVGWPAEGLVAPLIRPAKRGGRPRSVDVREVLNAIFYVLSTGCQWSAIPSDLPPRSTVWDYLDLWEWDGTIARIHDVLYLETRERAGRKASPTMAILDAQSAKGAPKGGLRSTPRAEPVLGPAEGWTRGMPARKCSSASATSSSTRRASS